MKEFEPKISFKNKLTNQLKDNLLKFKNNIKPINTTPNKVDDTEPGHDEYYEKYASFHHRSS